MSATQQLLAVGMLFALTRRVALAVNVYLDTEEMVLSALVSIWSIPVDHLESTAILKGNGRFSLWKDCQELVQEIDGEVLVWVLEYLIVNWI